METTTMGQQRSPFLHLPGELRNAVYAHIFGINDIVAVRRHLHSINPHQRTIGQYIHVLGICRQIRAEATPFLYYKSRILVDDFADLKRLATLSGHEGIVHIITPWRTAWTLVLLNRSSGRADSGSQRNAMFHSFKGLRKVSNMPRRYHEQDSREKLLALQEPFNNVELEVVWWHESTHRYGYEDD
jgi:hypothetical protein